MEQTDVVKRLLKSSCSLSFTSRRIFSQNFVCAYLKAFSYFSINKISVFTKTFNKSQDNFVITQIFRVCHPKRTVADLHLSPKFKAKGGSENGSVVLSLLQPQGLLQARMLAWVAVPSFKESSQLRVQTQVLPHCRSILSQLSHPGSPSKIKTDKGESSSD